MKLANNAGGIKDAIDALSVKRNTLLDKFLA